MAYGKGKESLEADRTGAAMLWEETKEKLKKLYQSLNPAELKRKIDEKVHAITFSRWREAGGPAPYKSPGGPEAC